MPARNSWQTSHVGQVVWTVHLDPIDSHIETDADTRLAGVARVLLARADELRLPIVWAVSDPAHSAATPRIRRSPIPHELALAGDVNWVGPTAGRTRFARELARRVLQARTAGIELSTFAPRVSDVRRHIDLVVKQRITAVAGVASPGKARRNESPRVMHYGVWEFPLSCQLPRRSHWLFSGAWTIARQLRRTALDGGVYHLSVDAAALCHEGENATRAVLRLMRRAADLRDRGALKVETMRSVTTRLADVPSATPQKSILRRAA